MMKQLAKVLMKYATWRKRVYYIKDKAGSDIVYMVRYIVLKTPFFRVYIHRFLKSDEEVPHDHPFNFLSYVIQGRYHEYLYDQANDFNLNIGIREEGSLAYRRATQIHRVKLDREYYLAEAEQAPLTVCLIGPKKRDWGFWPTYVAPKRKKIMGPKRYWVDWRKHLNLPANFKNEGQE